MNLIQLTFGVPQLVAGASEIAALVRTLETMWPGLNLRFRAEPGGPDGARMLPLSDPLEWIGECLSRNEHALLFGALNEPPLCVSFDPGAVVAKDGSRGAGVTVWLPEETLENGRLRQVLAAAGDAIAAWYGWFMPTTSAALILQLASKYPVMGPAAALLQAIPELSQLAELDAGWPASSVRVPSTIGWLNYWSNDTASSLQFRPQDALGGAARTARDAWTWQLTADPFDVQRPDHATALLDAYRRFRSALNHKN